MAQWAICICRYEGHDCPRSLLPHWLMSIALQSEHCQLTKAAGQVPDLQPSLPVHSSLQPLLLQAVMRIGGIQSHVILRSFIPRLLACCVCQIKIEISSKKNCLEFNSQIQQSWKKPQPHRVQYIYTQQSFMRRSVKFRTIVKRELV